MAPRPILEAEANTTSTRKSVRPPTTLAGMDIQLYVYDLTQGMARTMSRQLVGIQIDAVYHTSLVFGGIEYFFGAGVQTSYPGGTHHGQPIEIIPLGQTELPLETILEYLESLKEVYSPESYDLFAHNCNNFTNDFSQFLVGHGIPQKITNLPKRVLDTPFGQMLRPQLEQGMRSVTQAPVPSPGRSAARGPVHGRTQTNGVQKVQTNGGYGGVTKQEGQVIDVTSLSDLDNRLQSAANAAATIFFTSSTCAPCKMAYPMFDQLAAEYPKALFIKVDINSAREIGARYQVRATPTFMSYSKGFKVDGWQGADPNILKSNVERLIQQTWPPHPHTQLKVPTLQYGSLQPITYSRVPPLDKLMGRLGDAGNDSNLSSLRNFIQKRSEDAREAALPNLLSIGHAFQTKILQFPVETRFAAVDLLRCAMVDPRVSGFFAEEHQRQTISSLVSHVNELEDCPHNLRLVTLHLACNIFSSPLFVKELVRSGDALTTQVIQLITSSLLDASHPTTRVASASLSFNLACANYRIRREESREALNESLQVELAASLVETLSAEDNQDAAKAILLTLGYLVYCAPREGEMLDLMKALDAKATVQGVAGQNVLRREVESLLKSC